MQNIHIIYPFLCFDLQGENPLYEKASDEIQNPMYDQYMEGQSSMFTATTTT